jgi:hypothetical protein
MKKPKFTEAQIVFAIKQSEPGVKAANRGGIIRISKEFNAG